MIQVKVEPYLIAQNGEIIHIGEYVNVERHVKYSDGLTLRPISYSGKIIGISGLWMDEDELVLDTDGIAQCINIREIVSIIKMGEK